MAYSLKTDRAASVALPERSYDAAMQAIMAIPGLTGLWESDKIILGKGLRWKSRVGDAELTPYRNLPPVPVVASHGRPALQVGYGNSLFLSTDRGAFCVGENTPLFGSTGYTAIIAVKCAAGAETGGGTGGYLFASRNEQGANPELTVTPDNTDARLVIQSATGRPMLYGGGQSIQIATDVISGDKWRILTAYFDAATKKLGLRLDGGAAVQEISNAAAAMPSHVGALAPLFGIFNSSNPLPFNGQISGIATANRMLTAAQAKLIETRFASLYGLVVA